jgi:hypothetical protein
MALKDWTKVADNKYQIVWVSGKFPKKIGEQYVDIEFTLPKRVLNVYDDTGYLFIRKQKVTWVSEQGFFHASSTTPKTILIAKPKTKAEGLRIAKEYMRKH